MTCLLNLLHEHLRIPQFYRPATGTFISHGGGLDRNVCRPVLTELIPADLLLMSSENVRLIDLRKCPSRQMLPSQALVSWLCF